MPQQNSRKRAERIVPPINARLDRRLIAYSATANAASVGLFPATPAEATRTR